MENVMPTMILIEKHPNTKFYNASLNAELKKDVSEGKHHG